MGRRRQTTVDDPWCEGDDDAVDAREPRSARGASRASARESPRRAVGRTERRSSRQHRLSRGSAGARHVRAAVRDVHGVDLVRHRVGSAFESGVDGVVHLWVHLVRLGEGDSQRFPALLVGIPLLPPCKDVDWHALGNDSTKKSPVYDRFMGGSGQVYKANEAPTLVGEAEHTMEERIDGEVKRGLTRQSSTTSSTFA